MRARARMRQTRAWAPAAHNLVGQAGESFLACNCRMRLWTLHPRHLDAAGLVALWREALLAQAVLRGRTRGYRNHPQLSRFRALPDPLAAIAAYLNGIREEATSRGYSFDAARIAKARPF